MNWILCLISSQYRLCARCLMCEEVYLYSSVATCYLNAQRSGFRPECFEYQSVLNGINFSLHIDVFKLFCKLERLEKKELEKAVVNRHILRNVLCQRLSLSSAPLCTAHFYYF